MLKKIALSLSLFLFVAGVGMFYAVDARRTAAHLQHKKDMQAEAAQEARRLEKARAELAAQEAAAKLAADNISAQNLAGPSQNKPSAPVAAEDMNEILRQAPIEFEHLKKNSKLEKIAQNMQQKSQKALSEQVLADAKTTKWRDLLTAAGYEISLKRRPSNLNGANFEPPVVPFDEKGTQVIAFSKLTTSCAILKNPNFGAVLKINLSGSVVALAPFSKELKIPTEDIQRCKFKMPVSKQKMSFYKTMIIPAHKSGPQAKT